MSLTDKVKGLLRRHGSGIAFCGKVAARTLLPVGGERIADCLDALFELAKDKGDDLSDELLQLELKQLGAEQCSALGFHGQII